MNQEVKSDIWTKDQEGRPHLRGSKCMECEHLSFPAKEVCPYCMTSGKSEEVWIGQTGKVVSVTTCYTAPKGIQAPYSFGTIEVEGGVHVLAQISGNTIRKGEKVELVIYSHSSEESNEETMGWKYQIVEGGNR